MHSHNIVVNSSQIRFINWPYGFAFSNLTILKTFSWGHCLLWMEQKEVDVSESAFFIQTFRDLCSESFRCGCCGHTISSSAGGSSEVQPSTSLLSLLGPVHLSCRRNMGVQTRGAWVAMAFSDWVSGLGFLLIFLMMSLAVDATNLEPVYWNSLNRRYVSRWLKTHAPRYKFFNKYEKYNKKKMQYLSIFIHTHFSSWNRMLCDSCHFINVHVFLIYH